MVRPAGTIAAHRGYLALALLICVVGAPLLMTLWLSLRDPAGTELDGAAWGAVLGSGEAGRALAYSLLMGAAIATIGSFCGLPLAYAIAIRRGHIGRWLLALLLATALLDPGIRILGWMQILRSSIAWKLLPDAIQGSAVSELAAGIHGWLPVIVVLQALCLLRVSRALSTAARECGAGSWRIFRNILWPGCRGGLGFVALLVFCGASGAFLEPRLLGSPQFEQATEWLQRAMESENGWPYASVMLLLLLLAATLPVCVLAVTRHRK